MKYSIIFSVENGFLNSSINKVIDEKQHITPAPIKIVLVFLYAVFDIQIDCHETINWYHCHYKYIKK